MNKFRFNYLILFVLVLVFAACDKVDPNNCGGGQIVTGDTVRKLLLEDFTGHKCPNCPTAHKIIEDIQKVYGDRVVVMAIHAGFFASTGSSPYNYDFKTSDGTVMDQFFGASSAGLPKGVVNRSKFNGEYLLERAEFATAVSLVLDSMPQKPELYITLTPAFHSADSTLSVTANILALSALPAGKYNLSLVVVESNIIKAQKNGNPEVGLVGDILDYNHKHVYRGAINSTWGQEITDGAISVNQTFTKTYNGYKIGSDWKHDNLTIIGFVSYADGANDKVVIQAQSAEL